MCWSLVQQLKLWSWNQNMTLRDLTIEVWRLEVSRWLNEQRGFRNWESTVCRCNPCISNSQTPVLGLRLAWGNMACPLAWAFCARRVLYFVFGHFLRGAICKRDLLLYWSVCFCTFSMFIDYPVSQLMCPFLSEEILSLRLDAGIYIHPSDQLCSLSHLSSKLSHEAEKGLTTSQLIFHCSTIVSLDLWGFTVPCPNSMHCNFMICHVHYISKCYNLLASCISQSLTLLQKGDWILFPIPQDLLHSNCDMWFTSDYFVHNSIWMVGKFGFMVLRSFLVTNLLRRNPFYECGRIRGQSSIQFFHGVTSIIIHYNPTRYSQVTKFSLNDFLPSTAWDSVYMIYQIKRHDNCFNSSCSLISSSCLFCAFVNSIRITVLLVMCYIIGLCHFNGWRWSLHVFVSVCGNVAQMRKSGTNPEWWGGVGPALGKAFLLVPDFLSFRQEECENVNVNNCHKATLFGVELMTLA